MNIVRQIHVVLWKNFTIRRRRWPRVIFEIIWPLFLFLILMWVRTRNLTFYYDACHHDPKNLGSTGFLPSLQSYICRWNNTCYNQSRIRNDFTDESTLWQQLFRLSENLSEILDDEQISADLTKLFSQISRLDRYAMFWNGTIKTNKTGENFNLTIPSNLFVNPVNLSNLHQSWLMNRSQSSVSNLNVALEIYIASIRRNSSFSYQTASRIRQAFCDQQQLNRTFFLNSSDFVVAKEILCQNLTSNQLKFFLIEVQRQLDVVFLREMRPTIRQIFSENEEIVTTLNNLQQRLTILNPEFNWNRTNLSLPTLCDGRNDLKNFFSSSNQTSRMILSRSLNGKSSLIEIDWNNIVNYLFYYEESELCYQYYTTGSGNLIQYIRVNRTCRCILLDQVMRSNSLLRPFSNLLRPLLYGKIYYHPSNFHYDRLIKEINQIFESLDEFLRFIRPILSILRSNDDSLNSICETFPEIFDFCQKSTSNYRTNLNLATILIELIGCTDRARFVPVSSEAEMIRLGQINAVTNTFLAAIKFLDELSPNQTLPKHVQYKIRMTLDYVDSTFRTEDRYFSYQPRTSAPLSTKYHSFAFIYLQNSLERAIIKAQTGLNVSYGVQTQQMPFPCWINDKFVNSVSRMLPLFMVLSWIFTVSMNVKDIVNEKEKRLKEIMRIMGLKDTVHWFTWFVLCTTVMMFSAFLLVVLLKFGKITQHSDFLVLLLFFLCYTLATITQCFLFSVFFNRANLAACGAGILYFLLYLPYTILINYDTQTRTWQKITACFSSTVAFGLGCDYIARFEGMAKGIQWSNIHQGAKPNDNFTLLNCIIMMIIDTILYMFLTIYIENVFPGEYGIPRVWYFPLTKSYWFGVDVKTIRESTQTTTTGTSQSKRDTQNDDDQGELGIEIENLSKNFGNKMALKNLSVKFYRNMITAFLGRNGAGKSTTWSIITGLIPPSSGTVRIDGFDILTDIKIIRQKLGFVPQYNILFDLLTVKEHLEFFSRLKGAPKELMTTETKQMLIDLALENKSENYSNQLSGGMKRKLSIAIAFIGNSTTVILDEPTAGVDPYARRAIWDLILKYKAGRTIVLSTHHLDEADLLSDRLAIISSGELQCVGTTMSLKRKYGEGYNLIVELTPIVDMSVKSSNIVRFGKLTEFLRTFMFDIRVKEQHGDQITYIISDDPEHTRIFPTMFTELNENLEKFQMKTYGLSNSSLEQVFLRVADEIKRPEDYQLPSCWKRIRKRFKTFIEPVKDEIEYRPNSSVTRFCDSDWNTHCAERYTGMHYVYSQMSGLLIKRFHRTKRNVKGFIAEILLPIIFVFLAMFVTKLAPNESEPPALLLHPWYWGKPNHMFQSLPSIDASSLSKSIQKTFFQSPSFGTRCLKTNIFNSKIYPCGKSSIGFFNSSTKSEVFEALNLVDYNRTKISPDCDCWEKMQMCPIGGGGPTPNFFLTETKDVLFDLQGFNITDWSVKTEYQLEFLMKRFGGIEFFKGNPLNSIDLFSEKLLNQLVNITRGINSSESFEIDAKKIVSLFRIHPPEASIWYNNKGWPSSVAFVNIFNNALLRGLLLQQNRTNELDSYGISGWTHPLPRTDIQIDSELQNRATIELFTAICIIFALAFIPASFLVFLIDERVTTSKHLQFVSGLQGLTYWCGNFIWDMTNYSLSISCCLIIFLAFNIEAYVYRMNFLCLLLLLFLYGFATIPLIYPINYLFQTPSTGFVVISCINIFIGLMTTISTFTLENFSDEADLKRINDILMKVFLIFPHYCLGRGLFDMSRQHAINVINQKYLTNYVFVSPFQMNLVGRNLLALFFEGILFFVFTILVQYRFFRPARCFQMSTNVEHQTEDDDVVAERKRIHADLTNSHGDVLRLVDLVKVYGWRHGKTFTAVKRTCVGVKSGECFGLLGINGSGKSTTFKMLTGEIRITSGNAFVNNHSVIDQLNQVQEDIGYCPQFDALDVLLTAREHLYFYARLRGIKKTSIPLISESLLKRMGLTLWADRPVKQYSGGNKRKLSTAISLIGNPSIIFMDEPTTGMDVRAKRFLWNCILRLTREDQKSVIITSHSMEECETLCNRLVIMANGEFQCLGTVQHLKIKFGDGYTILIRIANEIFRKEILQLVQQSLEHVTIKEEHNKMIQLRISPEISLHKMFTVFEKIRDEHPAMIEDYTITQVTLDDVFVNFAKSRNETEK